MFIQTPQSSQPAGRIGDFEFFLAVLLIANEWFHRPELLNECNLYFKIVKYCILFEVCIINTAPHSNSPQVMYKKYKRLVYTPPQQDFRQQTFLNMSNARKIGLICFPRICFPGLIYCDQEPIYGS